MDDFFSQPSQAQYQKYELLLSELKLLGCAAIAFSGGVDSSFLLYAAKQALGNNIIAFTLASDLFPSRELNEAAEFCRKLEIPQQVITIDELSIPGFADNPPNRCYLCKKALFSRLIDEAEKYGTNYILEGSNIDDMCDYRPGLTAIAELGILSPLRSAGLYKADIRTLSASFQLPTAKKPSYACLASRFVYGERITPERLHMVEKAEETLISLGFRQMRVRIHGDLARIEVPSEEIERIAAPDIRSIISDRFQKLGLQYITLDLQGYRTGSMNETL